MPDNDSPTDEPAGDERKRRLRDRLKERKDDPEFASRQKAKLDAVAEEDPNVYPLY